MKNNNKPYVVVKLKGKLIDKMLEEAEKRKQRKIKT